MKRAFRSHASKPRDGVYVTADYLVADCPYCVEGYIRQPYGRLEICTACDGTGSTLMLAPDIEPRPPVTCEELVRHEAPKRAAKNLDWAAVIGIGCLVAGLLLLALEYFDAWKGIR